MLFKLKTLSENRERTVAELSKIDQVLKEISQEEGCEHYGQVLKEWYVCRTPKDEIAKAVGYSSKQSIYDIKNRAIRKFAVRHFGLEALRAS